MRPWTLPLVLAAAAGCGGEPPRAPVPAPELPTFETPRDDPAAREILLALRKRVLERPFYAIARLEIRRPGVERDLWVRIHYREPGRLLLRAQGSPREADATTLHADGRLHMFFPHADLRIDLPPSMGSDRLLGSDFVLDDLLVLGGSPERFAATLAGREEVEGEPCDHLVLRPRTADASLHREIHVWLTAEGGVPSRLQYVSDRGEVVREVDFAGARLHGIALPTQWIARSLGGAPSETTLHFRFFESDPEIDPALFTAEGLSRWR